MKFVIHVLNYSWWAVPLSAGILLSFGILMGLYFFLFAFFAMMLIGAMYIFTFKQMTHTDRSHSVYILSPLLNVIGLVLLLTVIEHIQLAWFLVALLMGLHASVFFGYSLLKKSGEAPIRRILSPAYHTLSITTVWMYSTLFFAVPFYFGAEKILYALPLLAPIPFCLWSGVYFQEKPKSRGLLFTFVFTLLVSEVGAALVFLPISYVIQSFVVTLLFVVFHEMIVAHSSSVTAGFGRHTAAFTFIIVVLLLILFTMRLR